MNFKFRANKKIRQISGESLSTFLRTTGYLPKSILRQLGWQVRPYILDEVLFDDLALECEIHSFFTFRW